MKKTIYYILLLFSLSAKSQLPIDNGTTKLNINSGGSQIKVNYGFSTYRLAVDDGYYNGFPMLSDVYNGESTEGVYKKSFTHGGAGYLMLLKTTNGGRNWNEDSIRVNSSVIHSLNHSFYRYPNGRMVISYRTDTSLKFAYNNSDDVNFTASSTIVLPATDYSIIQSPIKMVVTSYGSLLFTYYQVGSNGNPNSAIIMESLDSGLTFTQKSIVYTSNSAYPTNFPNCRGNEISICETHPTGVQATSKWMAIVRAEIGSDGGGYYMVYRSTDGANTWSQDLSTYSGSFVDDNGTTVTSPAFFKSGLYLFLSSNSPVDMKMIGDSIYVVNGDRNTTHGYALMYLSATPDSAFSNRITSWTRHYPVKYYYNGSNPGSSTDYGYPVIFSDGNTSGYVGDYTVSDLAPLPSVSRRCLIETVKVK